MFYPLLQKVYVVIPFLSISYLISKQLQNTTKLVFLEESYVNHLLCPHPLTIACRITAIVLSRFILDLRHAADKKVTSVPTQQSLQFAQRVEDGLGGTLNTIWGSGINEGLDDDEGVGPLEDVQVVSVGHSDEEHTGNER